MNTTASAERRGDTHSETSKLSASIWREASPRASRRMCGCTRGRRTIACLWGFGTAFLFVLEGRSQHVAQAGLELIILLPQPPRCG